MIGIASIPSVQEKANVYIRLQWEDQLISIDDLLLWSQWVRFDPRLGELMVKYIVENFSKYNPYEINKKLYYFSWPQSFLVLCEFSYEYFCKFQQNEKTSFSTWYKCVHSDFDKTNFQNFYFGLDLMKPDLLRTKIKKSLKSYLKWGYWSEEDLNNFNKYQNTNQRSRIPKNMRIDILTSLLQKNKKVTVHDYIEALNKQLHIRQAERDLKSYPNIKHKGFTRNRIYFI